MMNAAPEILQGDFGRTFAGICRVRKTGLKSDTEPEAKINS